jgi:hypothetical protein
MSAAAFAILVPIAGAPSSLEFPASSRVVDPASTREARKLRHGNTDPFPADPRCHGYSLLVLAHLLWACTSSPDGAPDGGRADGPSFAISISQGELEPAFDPDILHYAVPESSLVEPTTTIATSDSAAVLEHRTIDGEVIAGDAGSIDVPLAARQYVRVSAADRVYQITVVPSDLGIAGAEGVASEGAILLTLSPIQSDLDVAPYLLIVDERGTPIWYRRVVKPSYDFHATAEGNLLYIGDAHTEGLRGVVLGADYATERVVGALPGADGEAVETDSHFFDFQGDDAIVAGTSEREVDLTPFGAPEGCCWLRDFVIQQVAPDDTVLFEWNTKDHLDLANVPESLLEQAIDGFAPAHINSWARDPADDTWIFSNLWASEVLRVAPRAMTWQGEEHEAGDVLERIGGELSDYSFVDDERPNGSEGFLTSHSARIVAPDRLALYDNGYEPDRSYQTDSRAVEYAIDRSARTATRVWDTIATGSGSSPAGGSVERLPDGSTLVGWASAPVVGPWGPTVSEIGPDGEVAFTLTLAPGLWSYRASKAVRVGGRWTAP